MDEDTKTFLMGCFVACFIVGVIGGTIIMTNKDSREAEVQRVQIACGPGGEFSESTRTAQCVLALTGRGRN